MIIPNNILAYIQGNKNTTLDPYYVYDISTIKKQCRNFQSISYENKSIHFATMANSHPTFLSYVKQEGINVFVNSILHLQVALEAGFSKHQIIFTASALSENIMQTLQRHSVQVNLDSPLQLNTWLKLFPGIPVGIRCNIGDIDSPHAPYAGNFIGSKSRLGFTIEEINTLANKNVVNGLHLYVGTDIFDIDYFMRCYTKLIDVAANFSRLDYLNFGGGFGVSENGDSHFNLKEYNHRLSGLMIDAAKKLSSNLRLVLEPGRIIGAEAGYFVCKVTDLKKRPNHTLVGVNASTAQFLRPLLYPDIAKHPVMVLRNGVQVLNQALSPVTIYGCSTYSRDLFSTHRLLPEIKIGDIVVFGHAGSYAASMHSQFLGFPKPEEYFI